MVLEFQAYVGPQPFEEKDEYIFFGREREAQDLLSLVIAHNLVLLYAQSGAGKTSLINARLIPLLKKNQFEVFPVARVKGTLLENMKTQEISNIYVFNALTSWVEGDYDVKCLTKMKLVDFLNGQERKQDDYGMPLPRVVIFDQFEEIFSLYQDRWKDRKGFFEQVSIALKADPFLSVVFVIREDFIAQLDPYVYLLPERLRTRFHIECLRHNAALMAIEEPVKKDGRSFAEGVAEKLVDDLLKTRVETTPGEIAEITGEFIEAVQLQVVCQNLWRELPSDERQITFQHLKTYGNIEQELYRFYDEAIRAATEKAGIEEKEIRALFGEVLITTMGTRGMVYRAKESTGGIPNAAIDVLESTHIIRAEWRAGARWYELTHDRFIEPILSSNKVFNDKKAEQDRAEKERIEKERVEAKRVEQERAEKELIEKERVEAKRVEKELRAEKELAESKLLIFKGFTVLSIIVLIFGAIALYKWHEADVMAKKDRASSLSIQSYYLQKDDNSLAKSALLAIESYKVFNNSDADKLLRQDITINTSKCCGFQP